MISGRSLASEFLVQITAQSKGFSGRDWVFQELDTWLSEDDGNPIFLLTGEPGCGKSALASRLVQFSQGKVVAPTSCPALQPRFLSAFHFCSARAQTWYSPHSFTVSLALQLADRYPIFAEALVQQSNNKTYIDVQQTAGEIRDHGKQIGVNIENLTMSSVSAEDAFVLAIREPLAILASRQPDARVVILVDALDEALVYSGQTNIVTLLAQTAGLPSNVRFLLTSRQEPRVENEFLDADGLYVSAEEHNARNHNDIRHYVTAQFRTAPSLTMLQTLHSPEKAQKEIDAIVEKADGNFRYITFLLGEMEDGRRQLSGLRGLPNGLEGLYYQSLDRLVRQGERRWRNDYAPIFGILSVSQDALTLLQLSALTGQGENVLWDRLIELQQFVEEVIPTGKEMDGEQEDVESVYRLYHQSVADFFGNRYIKSKTRQLKNKYYLAAVSWHRHIADYYRNNAPSWAAVDWTHVDDYGLQHIVSHLVNAADNNPARLADFYAVICKPLMVAKLDRMGSYHSFGEDIELVIQSLESDSRISWPELMRLSLLFSTLKSISSRIEPELLGALARLNRSDEALGYAAMMPLSIRKSMAYGEITQALLENGDYKAALTACEHALTIRNLLAYTSFEIEFVVRMINSMANLLVRADCGVDAEDFVNCAFKAVEQLTYDPSEQRKLGALLTLLELFRATENVDGLVRSLDSIESFRDETIKVQAMARVFPAIVQLKLSAVLERVLAIANTIVDPNQRMLLQNPIATTAAQIGYVEGLLHWRTQCDQTDDSSVFCFLVNLLSVVLSTDKPDDISEVLQSVAEIDTWDDRESQWLVYTWYTQAFVFLPTKEFAVQVGHKAIDAAAAIEDANTRATALASTLALFAEFTIEFSRECWLSAIEEIEQLSTDGEKYQPLLLLISSAVRGGNLEMFRSVLEAVGTLHADKSDRDLSRTWHSPLLGKAVMVQTEDLNMLSLLEDSAKLMKEDDFWDGVDAYLDTIHAYMNLNSKTHLLLVLLKVMSADLLRRYVAKIVDQLLDATMLLDASRPRSSFVRQSRIGNRSPSGAGVEKVADAARILTEKELDEISEHALLVLVDYTLQFASDYSRGPRERALEVGAAKCLAKINPTRATELINQLLVSDVNPAFTYLGKKASAICTLAEQVADLGRMDQGTAILFQLNASLSHVRLSGGHVSLEKATAINCVATTLAHMGMFEDAVAQALSSHQTTTRLNPLLNEIARAAMMHGDPEQARAIADKIIDGDPLSKDTVQLCIDIGHVDGLRHIWKECQQRISDTSVRQEQSVSQILPLIVDGLSGLGAMEDASGIFGFVFAQWANYGSLHERRTLLHIAGATKELEAFELAYHAESQLLWNQLDKDVSRAGLLETMATLMAKVRYQEGLTHLFEQATSLTTEHKTAVILQIIDAMAECHHQQGLVAIFAYMREHDSTFRNWIVLPALVEAMAQLNDHIGLEKLYAYAMTPGLSELTTMELLLSLGKVLVAHGQPERGLNAAQKGVVTAKSWSGFTKDASHIARSYSVLAQIYAELGDVAQASASANKAVAALRSLDDPRLRDFHIAKVLEALLPVWSKIKQSSGIDVALHMTFELQESIHFTKLFDLTVKAMAEMKNTEGLDHAARLLASMVAQNVPYFGPTAEGKNGPYEQERRNRESQKSLAEAMVLGHHVIGLNRILDWFDDYGDLVQLICETGQYEMAQDVLVIALRKARLQGRDKVFDVIELSIPYLAVNGKIEALSAVHESIATADSWWQTAVTADDIP